MCTMKCPRCGQLATKPKPQDNFSCHRCGWKLAQVTASNRAGYAVSRPEPQQ